MVKKFSLLLVNLLICSFVTDAQSIHPYSLFGTLHPFELGGGAITNKSIQWSVAGSKIAYLPKGGFTQVQLESKFGSILVQQQIWDSYLRRNSFMLQGHIYPSKSLLITPLFVVEQMKIIETRTNLYYKGGITLRYQLSPNWRLASTILWDQNQKEYHQLSWIAGILYLPNDKFCVEFNIRKNELQSNLNTIALIKWQAHKKLNLGLGRCSNGELLWNTVWSYKAIKIATLAKFHPILGTTFSIALSCPLLLRTNR